MDFIEGLHKSEGTCNVEAVDQSLATHEDALRLLKFYLGRAQNRMKLLVDKHRTDKVFQIGDSVYLKLQPYRQTTMATRANMKLSFILFRPYPIVKKVGHVAYELLLPLTAKIHPVLHVSQLKAAIGDKVAQTVLPDCYEEGLVTLEPITVLEKCTIKRGNKLVMQVLVKWSTPYTEDAIWEDWQSLQQRFPSFHP
ncbi:Ty3/gypsy retrotransposon protein [Quillaja saponaria]|uniref:Ty3/gypsy retrotransposon protein n=1 Tax=Quillaja saponaria TaxID=32244 RepID=A0AAD7PLB2_QUISA|nr:Ty3/gypsy retrotransposon protein [Quillaja saponaria]